MRPLNRHPMSVAEYLRTDYLRTEESSPIKREYVGGFVCPLHGRKRATAGTTAAHNQIGVNCVTALDEAARQAGGWVYSFDLKLHITHNDIFFYLDVMVVRGETGELDATYVTDPCLLVEIISRRSVLVDRLAKYAAYTAIPSLQTYLIAEQDKRLVYAYQRGAAGWTSVELHGQGDIDVPCLGVRLSLDQIYRGLKL
jgi:Uma2 family endonuclease